jgi:hypothetical protein
MSAAGDGTARRGSRHRNAHSVGLEGRPHMPCDACRLAHVVEAAKEADLVEVPGLPRDGARLGRRLPDRQRQHGRRVWRHLDGCAPAERWRALFQGCRTGIRGRLGAGVTGRSGRLSVPRETAAGRSARCMNDRPVVPFFSRSRHGRAPRRTWIYARCAGRPYQDCEARRIAPRGPQPRETRQRLIGQADEIGLLGLARLMPLVM